MRLVQQVVIPLTSIPFDRNNLALGYDVLIGLPTVGQVASLTFDFRYQCQVPLKLINRAAAPQGGQLLFFKMVQSEEFSFHHSSDLDKHHLVVDIFNETRGVSFSKRLYFNKASLQIGFIDVRPGDSLKMAFCEILQPGSTEEKRQLI